jgi:hypothetical protein
MRYITRDGEVFTVPVRSRKVGAAILSCTLGAAIGIGFRLMLDLSPGIITSILSALQDLGMAIWSMLCNAAQAGAEFVHSVMQTKTG